MEFLEENQEPILLIISIILIISGIVYTSIQPHTISNPSSHVKARSFTDMTVLACSIIFGIIYWLYISASLLAAFESSEYLICVIIFGILSLLLMIIVSMFSLLNYKIKSNLKEENKSADPFQTIWRDSIIVLISLIIFGFVIYFYSSK